MAALGLFWILLGSIDALTGGLTCGFAIEAARLIADRHCQDVRLLDVRGLSQVCDYVLIGTGTSDRQMKSLADELGDFGDDNGQALFRADRDTNATWVVVDFVGLVAHLFEPAMRTHYDLEGLWSDAEHIRWQRDAGDGS
jgi:ribosome-associated protein